ncbi:MFS transporter [Salinisphaera sp. T31B1]|uniref:MFS transporter n=1 Tax=Salinisphaera sp. T31B1 TaxID=727963 RepID=UPI00333FEE16
MTRHRWYGGWSIVAAATLLTLLTVGMRLGTGPFFLPMAEDLGFSRSQLGSIVSVGMFFYGLAMPLAGWLVSRVGTRSVLIAGTVMVAVAVAWTVIARTPITLYLSFGILLSVGLGFISPVVLTPVICRWFARQRGKALFFLSTGSMAGIAVMTPLFSVSIAAFGWQATLIGFAAVLMGVALVTALWVIRDEVPAEAVNPTYAGAVDPSGSDPAPADAPFVVAVMSAPFLKIFLGLFACGFSMNLLGTHGVPMLMDHGFDSTTSSLGIGLIGLVAILGTVMIGRVADRVPRRNLLALIYGVRGLGFFALLMVYTPLGLYASAAVGGMVWAGSIATSSAMLADVYGVRMVGVLYGTAYVGHQIGATISTWLGGWGFQHFGTHWVAFGSAGVLLLLAAAISLRLPADGFVFGANARGAVKQSST